MLHTLLATALVAAATDVTPVTARLDRSSTRLDTALAVPAAKRLTLDLRTGGEVKIVGSQTTVVRIRVTQDGRDCGDCGVELQQGAEGMKISSAQPVAGSALRFEIEVPEQFDLDLASTGGAIRIEGVGGTIKGATESGALELQRLSGDVDLQTKRGDVVLRESYVSGRVHTVGGRVLLEDVSGSVTGSSAKGTVIERRVQRG